MATPRTSGHAPVNGIQMYYEIYGYGGVPLVLIHGGGSTIESTFSKLIPLLSADAKVIAVELQAHGRTTDRNAPESFEQDADDVAALLAHLQIPKANFLGFSNGGTTTLQIAMRHPDLVNKLIIVSANYRRDGMIPGLFDWLPQATLDTMPQPLRDAFLKVNPSQEGLQNMFEKDKNRMIGFKDIADEQLQTITAPTLIISNDKDVILPNHILQLAQLIAGSRVILLPGTHGTAIGTIEAEEIGFGNQPAITAAIVADFLTGDEA
ncbi:alpha/beta hydrolase [Mucilaginibacter sp. RS28]|uniref:Alpha/beta hydrolase n=1 Tax=Mucilaginibacter straminoryzae TaxID=2932774 RepID=A0A9X2B8V9_9SPHI|nr:alpha/beta hydrolase [Mucilaginibacter straminoryzae]MCJ8209085.1 alpha/beta hydrolase [Mucilaginibacter straminoryzae]